MIMDHPCKVTQHFTLHRGRSAIGGIDIFTHKKYETVNSSSAIMQVPIVSRCELEIADIAEDGFVYAIMEDGSLLSTLKLPTETK